MGRVADVDECTEVPLSETWTVLAEPLTTTRTLTAVHVLSGIVPVVWYVTPLYTT